MKLKSLFTNKKYKNKYTFYIDGHRKDVQMNSFSPNITDTRKKKLTKEAIDNFKDILDLEVIVEKEKNAIGTYDAYIKIENISYKDSNSLKPLHSLGSFLWMYYGIGSKEMQDKLFEDETNV